MDRKNDPQMNVEALPMLSGDKEVTVPNER